MWVCLVSRAPVVLDSVDLRVGQNLHVLCYAGALVCPIGSPVSKRTVFFGALDHGKQVTISRGSCCSYMYIYIYIFICKNPHHAHAIYQDTTHMTY